MFGLNPPLRITETSEFEVRALGRDENPQRPNNNGCGKNNFMNQNMNVHYHLCPALDLGQILERMKAFARR